MLMISRRIWPARTAINFAAMISICQFIMNWVRGLSSRKQRCAKLTKSRRSNVSYVVQVNLSAAVIIRAARRSPWFLPKLLLPGLPQPSECASIKACFSAA
jgi:hypothetical protein